MKRYVSVAVAIGLVLSIMLFTGCSKKSDEDALKLEDGILTWSTVESAASYEVDLGGGGISVKGTSYNLIQNCDTVGKFTVTVRSVDSGGKRDDIGSMEITSSQVSRPVVGIETVDDELYVVWEAAKDVTSYSYDAHDGKGVQKAQPASDGSYRVPVTDTDEQMFRVIAEGSSRGSELLLSNEVYYQYRSGHVFDLSLLGQYKAVYTNSGLWNDSFRVGTTLPKGVYDLEVYMYVFDSEGYRLTGEGNWGRRIACRDGKLRWFCEHQVEDKEGSADTIPSPDEVVKETFKLSVDAGGNACFTICDFTEGERIVFADIRYNGVSVLDEDGGLENPVTEIEKFDVSSIDNYMASFVSKGVWASEDPEACKFSFPVNLPDGDHIIKVSYYLCQSDGSMLEDNGMWGRRLTGSAEGSAMVWYNEYDINEDYKAVAMPKPTEKQSSRFKVTVKGGIATLMAYDFEKGERIIISDVQTAGTLSGNGVYVAGGERSEEFRIQTTLTGLPRHIDQKITVTFEVSDVFGDSLTGNAMAGRRIEDDERPFWLCEKGVDNFPEAANTLPKAGERVTKEMFVYEINKLGVLKLHMWDFEVGEVVRVTSIKDQNGNEILAK